MRAIRHWLAEAVQAVPILNGWWSAPFVEVVGTQYPNDYWQAISPTTVGEILNDELNYAWAAEPLREVKRSFWARRNTNHLVQDTITDSLKNRLLRLVKRLAVGALPYQLSRRTMSLDFYPAQSGHFTNPFNDQIATVKADEPAQDYCDVVSFNQSSAAKLIPLLALPVEDGYGEIAAADLYQRCHAVLLKHRNAIEEFTCAEDTFLAQILGELGAGTPTGPQVVNIGTDAHTVEGLRRRVLQLKDLALIAMQRHGSRGYIQMC